MKLLEIQTPELRRAIGDFDTATSGTLDLAQARVHLAAGNGRIKAVGEELKVRLAMPKVAAMEAKQIDGSQQESAQIEQKSA